MSNIYLFNSFSRISKHRLENNTVLEYEGTILIVLLRILAHQKEILNMKSYYCDASYNITCLWIAYG